jgi:hypothetical protein
MKFLRVAPTSRLLAVIAGIVVAIAAGTAIAVAASGGGPVPKREPLATALHSALKSPSVQGVSARIKFTNGLIGASDFQGTDPLLQGASGRLWLGDNRMRLELQSDNGDTQVVINGTRFWITDPASQTVYEGTLPGGSSAASGDKTDTSAKSAKGTKGADHGIPSVAKIEGWLSKLAKRVDVSGAIPGDIAGHAAYSVRLAPRHDGGLLGAVKLGWDAVRGVPLNFAIYARGSSSPVLALQATDISYGKVSSSVFNISPPSGDKVVRISTPAKGTGASSKHAHGKTARAEGVKAVAAKLPFKLVAPAKLVGLPRHGVSLMAMGGERAALVTYGEGLGGIAVIEHAQSGAAASSSQSSGPNSFSLPTVSIHGSPGTELDTALGTVITFTRGGVGYTVLGSVPASAAALAARAL